MEEHFLKMCHLDENWAPGCSNSRL